MQFYNKRLKQTKLYMYAIIDGLCFIAGIVGFILCFTQNVPYYCPIPIAWITVYPILNELIYDVCAWIFGGRVLYNTNLNSRIVYHPSYNITFCGIEKMHPFDSQKYGNAFKRLLDMSIATEQNVIKPNRPPRRLLLEKMSPFYLFKMNYSIALSSYVQLPLCFIPAFLLRWRLLNPMLLATEGTILACIAALKLRWTINLAGGYHHASCFQGGGFCIYPDISLAIHYLQSRMGIQKVMIIDLDAHQGNGHERDHVNRDDVFIVDAYNHNIYPGDTFAKRAISKDISVRHNTTNEEYIQMISTIEDSMRSFKPNFVIYNAGTDCLIGDPLGNLSITEQGIIKRDQTIFDMCLRNNIPICMILSGGYQLINAKVIADSIKNLYNKFDSIY